MSDERYPDLGTDETPGAGTIDRRGFLQLFGGGIVIFFTAGDVLAGQEPGRLQTGAGAPADFNAYLRIGEDGRITLFTGKIEQGQGAMTVLPLMLAEELEVPQASVDIVLGDTDLCPYDAGTFGSLAVRSFGPQLRAASAEAREVLCELAAEKLGLPRERLQARDGAIVDSENPKTKATYAELAKGQAIARRAKQKPGLKPPSEFKVMGRSVPRRDARDKATGAAKYAGDIRLPGMLYARLLRPPAHGSTLKAIDVSAAEKVPGARVVQDGDLVAVLHELPDAAADALAKIKAEYDKPPVEVDDKTIHDHLVKVAPQGKAVAQGGELAAGEKLAAFVLEERYLNAYVAHSTLETHTALVKLDGDKATVWSSTQSPFGTRTSVAQALKVPPENVHCIMPYVGGGFGGKTGSPQAVQAARLARITASPSRSSGRARTSSSTTRSGRRPWSTSRPGCRTRAGSRSGITRSSTPASGAPSSSTTSPTTGPSSGGNGAAGAAARRAGIRSASAPGALPGATRTRSPGRSTSTPWRRKRAWTRSNSG